MAGNVELEFGGLVGAVLMMMKGNEESRESEDRHKKQVCGPQGSKERTYGLASGTLELSGRSLLVDLLHVLLIRSCLLTGLDGGSGEKVSSNEAEVRHDLSSLRVGEKKGEEGSKMN